MRLNYNFKLIPATIHLIELQEQVIHRISEKISAQGDVQKPKAENLSRGHKPKGQPKFHFTASTMPT